MHDRNRAGAAHRVLQFVVHEGEVGHGVRVVEFQGIGVQADEFGVPRPEGEVFVPVDFQEHVHPVAEDVVVPEQGHVRHFQSFHDVPHPEEFFRQAEIGDVAAMDHEVDVVPVVEGFHEGFRFVVPALAVAH